MKKLRAEYWDTFIEINENGEEKGNGEKFEDLVECLLIAKYGENWTRTKRSHDDNRDFWIYLNERHVWAECKNYQNSIAMNILAPTLVMAQIYEVNEILFFSRSEINQKAKDKILAFGEKSEKIIVFFDGDALESLIWRYRNHLPEKYSPLIFFKAIDIDEGNYPFVHIYFFRNAVSKVENVSEVFVDYVNADTIYYNETFALTFCLTNFLQEDNVEIGIEFMDESEELFYFQYFYPTLTPGKKQWYRAYLKEGEGRSISLNMRQIRYETEIHLPRFHVWLISSKSGQRFDWYSKAITVKCNWVGKTKLLGSNYLKILDKVKEQLINNPSLSSLILTGSSGTGKSRILTESQNIFLKNGYQIINFSGQEDFSSHYFLKELISFLYEIPSDDVLNFWEERLFQQNSADVLWENTKVEKAVHLLRMIMQSNTEDSLQEMMDTHAGILYEKLSQSKIVLIVDNVQYAGSAFQHFLEQYIYYAINQQSFNRSVLLLVYNLDYMTETSSEMLYNILHSNIQHLLSFRLKGFLEMGHGITFLQELTRTREDENIEFFSGIIKKVSLTPYNLYQTVKYLEEINIIKITPEKQGYIAPNLSKYNVLSNIVLGIADVLEKRLQFLSKQIVFDRILFICSVEYIFDSIDKRIQGIFKISSAELNYLCEKNILRLTHQDIYFFDHDIIRNFFCNKYKDHILDCLNWLHKERTVDKIRGYRTTYSLYKIAVQKDYNAALEIASRLAYLSIPERSASFFYNCLLEAFAEMLENGYYHGVYLKYIHQVCAYIRQYDGSEKAWIITRRMYDIIQTHCPNALLEDIRYYRPFIHFCCDISVQLHFYEDEIQFIEDVLYACENTHPIQTEDKDELYALQAIMYNRWYISYNNQSFKGEIKEKRKFLMNKSRAFGEKITDPQKRGLIEYLNNSDEGYNFYGYQKDKEKLLNIWDNCIIDIPTLVPEKTLNYYRKTVQYGLINQDEYVVKEESKKALDYLLEGKFSHEPTIFRTFFLMAEVMSNLQNRPEETYYYNARIIDDIMQIQQLLNNHKLGDILLLKGVNAYYAGNENEVYYAFKEAYEYYEAGKTSRYWIKKFLLEENICYTFTTLRIYKMGYDVSCFPVKCRQPLLLSKQNKFQASGIQRTGDLHLNLPLI